MTVKDVNTREIKSSLEEFYLNASLWCNPLRPHEVHTHTHKQPTFCKVCRIYLKLGRKVG